MKTTDQIYNNIIKNHANEIDAEIKHYHAIQKAKVPYSPWIWGILGWIIGIAAGQKWYYGVAGVLVMLFIIGLFRPQYRKNTLLSTKISDNAIVTLAKDYFSKVSFERYEGLRQKEFEDLFGHECDDYWSEYRLKGIHNGLKFRICNAQGSYEEEYEEEYTDSDGETYTETKTETIEIFNGTILRIALPHPFKHPISIGQFRTKESMDHQQFNQYYSVQSYDRIYARYVLTQSFMDRLVNLAYVYGKAPRMEFDDRYIYVMFERQLKFDDIGYFSIKSDIEMYEHEIKQIYKILETIAFYDHHIINNQDRGAA